MTDPWHAFDAIAGKRERFPIDTAPRDGTLIYIGDPDVGEFPMQWAHIQRNGLFPGVVGMWVMPKGEMTWNDADGFGPTVWRPISEDQ